MKKKTLVLPSEDPAKVKQTITPTPKYEIGSVRSPTSASVK